MEKNQIQVLIIRGGMTFKNQKDYISFLKKRNLSLDEKISWNGNYLKRKLGKKFKIIMPRMPLQDNAQYKEWKIHFERYLPLLDHKMILIGTSLGGTFLAKYLSENKLPKKAISTYLICPPFDNTLEGEDLVGGFELKKDLSLIEKNSRNTTLMFSKNDEVVPISHAEKYKNKLKKSKIIIYENKNGHFRIQKFPEIIKMIKKDVRGIRK